MKLDQNLIISISCGLCLIITLTICTLLARKRPSAACTLPNKASTSTPNGVASQPDHTKLTKNTVPPPSSFERNAVLEDMVSEAYFWAMSASQESIEIKQLVKVCYAIGILTSIQEILPIETLGKTLLPPSLGSAQTLLDQLVLQRETCISRLAGGTKRPRVRQEKTNIT